ncbi:MAG: hypothetical protein BGO07_01500 [Alphaproteobacteria bacterium 40-19]|nr:MAG: hypothetical protein BGO07_01500 [Alphaproteobacteria bacterium 40-19]
MFFSLESSNSSTVIADSIKCPESYKRPHTLCGVVGELNYEHVGFNGAKYLFGTLSDNETEGRPIKDYILSIRTYRKKLGEVLDRKFGIRRDPNRMEEE